MSRNNHEKTAKLSLGGILLRVSGVLFALVFIGLVAFSVASYARYVSEKGASNSAAVAGEGIEVFEMVEHGAHGENDVVTGVSYDCTRVIPGVDIPGPHVRLKVKSEVSYTLYVEVKVPNAAFIGFGGNGGTAATVTYRMAANWVQDGTPQQAEGYTVYKYKYNLATDPANDTPNYVFQAGQQYEYDGDGAIRVLADDKVYVSQNFDPDTSSEFSLSFRAYMQQTL